MCTLCRREETIISRRRRRSISRDLFCILFSSAEGELCRIMGQGGRGEIFAKILIRTMGRSGSPFSPRRWRRYALQIYSLLRQKEISRVRVKTRNDGRRSSERSHREERVCNGSFPGLILHTDGTGWLCWDFHFARAIEEEGE